MDKEILKNRYRGLNNTLNNINYKVENFSQNITLLTKLLNNNFKINEKTFDSDNLEYLDTKLFELKNEINNSRNSVSKKIYE